MPFRAGTRIGPYEVVAPVGAGGMGEVYKARDTRLERMVALKVMRSGISADENHRKRFLREARATAAFSHPGIAALYDAGEAEDLLYLAMEYVPGHTLQQEIAQGPISGQAVREYALQVATALEHAHARGILHRDIKPANIMVAEDGTLRLLDFGLAHFTIPQEETATLVTMPGTFVGTYQYCAPEVLSGRTASVRSDIYSLGVVMYEMACGRTPFAGLQERAMISAALLGEMPPVRKRNPAVSELLANVIERSLAAQPQERFASAAELAAALRTMEGRPNSVAIVLERANPVIAVLDFENLSGDPASDWLTTGIAETITADLRKLKNVQVVSRELVQQRLRRMEDRSDTAALGRILNARWLVMGSFQRSGSRIRITPNLLEAATGESAPLGKIDGAWDDLFELQDRAVREILLALNVEMDSGARRRIATPETLRLEAYEHFTEGQKGLLILGKDSIENARRHLERAIELDPEYAVAYSALGQTYAMRWIFRNDPDDLARASGCLEGALELDPELGAPYGHLAYVYVRQNKIEKGLEAGLKAVRSNPDVGISHYYVGLACWAAGLEISDSYLQKAVDHFLDAIEVEPALSASWLNLGTIAMHNGAYDRAQSLIGEVFSLRASRRAVVELPFGEMIQAEICMRRLEWDQSLEWHERGLKYMGQIDSVYRETAAALHGCGMAEVRLRQNQPEEALADLHRSWRIAREFPNMMAHKRLLTRTLAQMAWAYAALGDRTKAEQLLNDASKHFENVLANPGGMIHGVVTFDLCHPMAIAYWHLNQQEVARAMFAMAVEKGWPDAEWMESDPELKPLLATPDLDSVRDRVRHFPALHFGAGIEVAGTPGG
jgi:eukaryotic-like serine/threonine-protein kinase